MLPVHVQGTRTQTRLKIDPIHGVEYAEDIRIVPATPNKCMLVFLAKRLQNFASLPVSHSAHTHPLARLRALTGTWANNRQPWPFAAASCSKHVMLPLGLSRMLCIKLFEHYRQKLHYGVSQYGRYLFTEGPDEWPRCLLA